MRYYFLILLCVLSSALLNGCGTRTLKLTEKDHFDSPYLSFNAPAENWYAFDKIWSTNKDKTRYNIPIFNRASTNGSLVIEVISRPTKKALYFDKVFDYELMYTKRKSDPKEIEINRDQGIGYDEAEVTYYRGMKCTNSVFSRSYGGDAYSASSKNYLLTCGYYHKTEGKRIIKFSYRYYGASGVSKLQEQSGMKESDVPSLNEAERVLKEDLKEVLDSVVIKDVDWARMEKEGLIYDKPYKTIKW